MAFVACTMTIGGASRTGRHDSEFLHRARLEHTDFFHLLVTSLFRFSIHFDLVVNSISFAQSLVPRALCKLLTVRAYDCTGNSYRASFEAPFERSTCSASKADIPGVSTK